MGYNTEVLQRDPAAILRAGVPLSDGLGAAAALYGNEFPPIDAVKALAYYEGGTEEQVDAATRRYLTRQASLWDLTVGTVRKAATSLTVP